MEPQVESAPVHGPEAIRQQGGARRAGPPRPAQNPQRHLDGAIAPALLRLALPVVIVLSVQTGVSVAETYFVGQLGTEALAGMTLVFPILLMMTMISSGGIGGAVAASIAQAIGAGRTDEASSVATHTLGIAVAFGLACTAAAWAGGPALYRMLGGSGAVLDTALIYSNLAFAAAVPIWIVNLLSATIRAAGNVRVPALTIVVAAMVTICLSPLLMARSPARASMRRAGLHRRREQFAAKFGNNFLQMNVVERRGWRTKEPHLT